MKKKYEKPTLISEKMEMNLLHTICSPGNLKSPNYWPPNPKYPVCNPVKCSDLGTKLTNYT
jgi:hypothetical protein